MPTCCYTAQLTLRCLFTPPPPRDHTKRAPSLEPELPPPLSLEEDEEAADHFDLELEPLDPAELKALSQEEALALSALETLRKVVIFRPSTFRRS